MAGLILNVWVSQVKRNKVSQLVAVYGSEKNIDKCYVLEGKNGVTLQIHFTFEQSKNDFVKKLKLIK